MSPSPGFPAFPPAAESPPPMPVAIKTGISTTRNMPILYAISSLCLFIVKKSCPSSSWPIIMSSPLGKVWSFWERPSQTTRTPFISVEKRENCSILKQPSISVKNSVRAPSALREPRRNQFFESPALWIPSGAVAAGLFPSVKIFSAASFSQPHHNYLSGKG